MKPEPLLAFGIRTFWPLFGAMWLVCGVLLILIAGWIGWGAFQFERRAIEREGRVISVSTAPPGGRSSTRRTIVFRFTALDGREIIGRQAVRARTWNAVQEGTRVRIAYLPDDPSRNRLTNERELPGAVLVLLVGTAVSVFGGALLGHGVARYRRQRHLAATSRSPARKGDS